jgi:hypothetical protein
MTALLLLLLFAAAGETRAFHPVPLAHLEITKWTHVHVCGTVALVKHEADGDIHIRLEDGKAFIVAEIVPYHRLPPPKLHTRICVDGISRKDGDHGWSEVHPIEAWTLAR